MPKATTFKLPSDAKFQIVDGQTFFRLREAAKLAGIPPVVLEMGQRLLQQIGQQGCAFPLSTAELQKNGLDIAKTFKLGLRRYVKAMEPTAKIKVKAYKDGQRLVFWWLDLPRERFTAAAAAEHPRMATSRYGRIQNLVVNNMRAV